jgi:predicted methyltransferase
MKQVEGGLGYFSWEATRHGAEHVSGLLREAPNELARRDLLG